jgi:hypothetical protein
MTAPAPPSPPEPMPSAELDVLRQAARADPITTDVTSSALTDSSTSERYVGSAALESTLDSTIESSLLGLPTGPITMAALPGGSAVSLPPQLEADVIVLMDSGHEVAAVRLVCDAMDVGILESMRSVRGVAGLPTP